jgi:hypothetical protein
MATRNNILNYTTSVPAESSAGFIMGLLGRKGANSISQHFANGKLAGISFVFPVGGFPVNFQLPAREDGVLAFMLKQEPWNSRRGCRPEAYTEKLRARAGSIAWRILKDWVEAQVAMVEAGQAEMGEVFMPYAITDQGMTMYDQFLGFNQQKQLGSGGKVNG